MSDNDDYAFAENELLLESQRLQYGHAANDPVTVECMEAIGVARGWRCLDVGAGAGSITRWLARRVGPEGRVVALDYNTRFLTGLPGNVTVRQADVREDDAFVERDYFDLAHCRLLLIWMTDPMAVLRRMAASLRPGGVLLAEEGNFDLQSVFGYPEAAELNRIFEAKQAAGTFLGPAGYSPYRFRYLADMLAEVGLEPVDVRIKAEAAGPGDPMFEVYRLIYLSAKTNGLGMDDKELAAWERFCGRPEARVIPGTLIRAWARRP
jgi:SAM-dependent methyltransferase